MLATYGCDPSDCSPLPQDYDCLCPAADLNGDAFELNDCPALATAIGFDTPQLHSGLPEGDVDYLRFEAERGQVVHIVVPGGVLVDFIQPNCQTFMFGQGTGRTDGYYDIVEETGTQLARLTRRPWTATDVEGDVTLTRAGFDDHAGRPVEGTPIAVGEVGTGYASFLGPWDCFLLDVQTEEELELHLTIDPEDDAPSFLRPEMGAGTVDGGELRAFGRFQTDTRPAFHAIHRLRPGLYGILVRLKHATPYTLTVPSFGLDLLGDLPDDATRFVPDGQLIEGQVTNLEEDWLEFVPEEGMAYDLTVTGTGLQMTIYTPDGTWTSRMIEGTDSMPLNDLQADVYQIRIIKPGLDPQPFTLSITPTGTV
ncbi:MAG: hypothetical protein ACI9MR_002110 [Myxococcota bacterium]